jgi:hypothetical protein
VEDIFLVIGARCKGRKSRPYKVEKSNSFACFFYFGCFLTPKISLEFRGGLISILYRLVGEN